MPARGNMRPGAGPCAAAVAGLGALVAALAGLCVIVHQHSQLASLHRRLQLLEGSGGRHEHGPGDAWGGPDPSADRRVLSTTSGSTAQCFDTDDVVMLAILVM